MRELALVWLLLAAVASAGCGRSSNDSKVEKKQVTLPAYGGYRATTETVTVGSPAVCRRAAQALTRDAVAFLVPSPTPADDYFIAARTQFIDFQAHTCDLSILRSALSRRLDAGQRRSLIARLPFLPESLR